MNVSGRLSPTVHRHALVAFLLLAGLTAAVMRLDVAVPVLLGSGYEAATVRVAIHLVILIGLGIGLSRTTLTTASRAVTWLALAVPFVGWLVVVWEAALAGFFRPNPGGVPWVLVAIAVPLVVCLPVLLRSGRIGALLSAISSSWLVGLHAYRIFGSGILVGGLLGGAPLKLALPIGLGDVIVGLLALPVALYLDAGARNSRVVAIAWNVLGLLDLIDALLLTYLVGPAAAAAPNRTPPPTIYPAAMTAVFTLPSVALLHALSLRQLFRLPRDQKTVSVEGPAVGLVSQPSL